MYQTKSQKALSKKIVDLLQDREIVCLWGNPSGKTHIHYAVKESYSVGYNGKMKSEVKRRHDENYSVEILEGVEVPIASNEVSLSRIRRSILMNYGQKPPFGSFMLHKEFMSLLVALEKERIIPCIAVDNVEMMPQRGYTLIKMLNQLRTGGKRIGVASLLAGNFSKRRMPANFWSHIAEVQIGKITQSEIAEFIGMLAPGKEHLFSEKAIRKIAECESTLEMSARVRRALEYMNDKDLDLVTDEVIGRVSDRSKYVRAKMALAA